MLNPDMPTEALIQILGDPGQPGATRQDAIDLIDERALLGPSFSPHKPDYTVALRSAGTAEDDEVLKLLALQNLCMAKDRPTQKSLIAGLEDPSVAHVPAETALRFLSYDVHAGVYPIARQYAATPPNDDAQYQAMRILGSDPDSVEIFATILADTSEDLRARRLSSACLMNLDPERYVVAAKTIAADAADEEEIRTAVISALVSAETSPEDQELRDMAQAVSEDPSANETMQRCAKLIFARTPGPQPEEDEEAVADAGSEEPTDGDAASA